jgi:3D (Asp-Asp-Asp) domain-containing protein
MDTGSLVFDTSVIPFGTKLYIEGYGYAVAGDTVERFLQLIWI